LGEIWTADPRWANDKHFDGLMNYPLRDALLRLLHAGTLDMPHFANKVETLLTTYPRENVYSMHVPLGSHLSFSLDPVFHIFTGKKEIFGTLTGLGPIKSLHR
jgi:hypothetical protein